MNGSCGAAVEERLREGKKEREIKKKCKTRKKGKIFFYKLCFQKYIYQIIIG
jgi:hypothetical protein